MKGWVILAILAMAIGTASAESRPRYGGEIVGSLVGAPTRFDPIEARSHADVSLSRLVFATLYRQRANGTIVPSLASTMPEPSRDGRSVRIRVRSGATFHDGTPITASDVASSLRRVMRSRHRWMLAPVRQIDVDGSVLSIRLRRRAPDLVELLAAPATSITKGGLPPRSNSAAGSGPFRLVNYDHRNGHVTLSAHEAYFDGRAYFDRLTLRWFESASAEARAYEVGKSHVSLRGASAFVGRKPRYATVEFSGPANVLSYVGFGGRSVGLDSIQFRRGLSMAIDRVAFRRIGSGEAVEVATTPVQGMSGGAPIGSIGEARALVARAKAAFPATLGSTSWSPEVLIDKSRPEDREVAEKILAALYQLGWRARIVALDSELFVARVENGRCDLFVGQLVPMVSSVPWQLAAINAREDGRWIDSYLQRGVPKLETLSRRFNQRLPIVPLFRRAIRLHHWRNLHGFLLDAASVVSFADAFVYGRP